MKFKGKHYVKKEDLKEDRFQQFIEKTVEAYYRDRQRFWIGGAVILVAIVGIILLLQSRRPSGINPKAEVALTQAVGIYSMGNMAQAETAFKDVAGRFGRDFAGTKSHFYLGNIYYNTGRFNEAKAEFAKLLGKVKSDPLLSPASQFGIGNCEEQLGNNLPAAQAYEAVTKRWPKSPMAFDADMAAARCYRNAGAYDKSQAIYERLLKDNKVGPLNEEVKTQLAYIQALQKKFQ